MLNRQTTGSVAKKDFLLMTMSGLVKFPSDFANFSL